MATVPTQISVQEVDCYRCVGWSLRSCNLWRIGHRRMDLFVRVYVSFLGAACEENVAPTLHRRVGLKEMRPGLLFRSGTPLSEVWFSASTMNM